MPKGMEEDLGEDAMLGIRNNRLMAAMAFDRKKFLPDFTVNDVTWERSDLDEVDELWHDIPGVQSYPPDAWMYRAMFKVERIDG
jgi:hypothetical protein